MSKKISKSSDSWSRRRLRQISEWLLGFHGSPKQVARGMAVGVFVAFTPTVGLQMIIAAILATLTYSSRAAAMAAVWITNPFSALPIYVATYRIGRYVSPSTRAVNIRQRLRGVILDEDGEWLDLGQQIHEITMLGSDVLIPLTVGGFIIGTLAAVPTYILTRMTLVWAVRHLHFYRAADTPT